MQGKLYDSTKAICTLVTGIIVAVLAIGVDETWAKYLAYVLAVAGAITTWLAGPPVLTKAMQESLLPDDNYPEGYDAAMLNFEGDEQ